MSDELIEAEIEIDRLRHLYFKSLHEARASAAEIERLTAELNEATEIIKLQLRGYRTSKDSVRAFAFVDKHSE